MKYLSVAETAKKWDLSERTVRNYCAKGRIADAFLTGKTWNIPESAIKPERINSNKTKPITLLDIIRTEKSNRVSGGIYHKIQVDLTYNSNNIEGNKLTYNQVKQIYETNAISADNKPINVLI